MPLQLPTPEVQPAVALVAKEIVEFSVDLQRMTAQIRFSFLDADGNRHPERDQLCNISLVTRDGDGNITGVRFTPQEYGSIKTALYRLATEDGFSSGAVL
jgi:hypothetical protein